MSTKQADVIVVGAGISGLTAARHLLSKDPNLQVLVLEAKGRVGGRTESVQLKTSNGTDTWDVGGQWVGRSQPHVMSLLQELGLETHDQYISGLKFLQTGRKNRMTSYRTHIPQLSLMALLDLDRMLKKTDSLALEVDPTDPYSGPQAEVWDAMTLETFIQWNMWTTEAKDVIRACMRTMFGAELSQLSVLYYLMYVAAAGNIKYLTEATENAGQEYRIKGGAQQISLKMYEALGSSRVFLNEPVSCIEQDDDQVTVTSFKQNIYTCQKLILAIPPSQIGKINFSPILPVETREIIKRMPPSNIIKVIVTYAESFWRKAGQSGEVVSNGGLSTCRGCTNGPIGVVYDAMSSGDHPALLAFIGGLQAVEWQQQTVKARKSAVLKSLSEFFGERIYTYVDYREKIWDEEPYNEGAPVSCVAPGAMRFFAKGLRQPFQRIHFAGTESATVWCGFMNGAVQAGRRAAIEVLYDLRPQLVAVQDFAELKPPRTRELKSKSRGRKRKVVKWTAVLGVMTLVVFTTRKIYLKWTFN